MTQSKLFASSATTTVAPLPEPDVRTPIRVTASRRLRAFALSAQASGAAAITWLLWQGDFSLQAILVISIITVLAWVANAYYTGIFSQYSPSDYVAFGIHAAARPDVFDTLDNTSDAHHNAPGTIASVAPREALNIFVQTRSGVVLQGELTATQFIAPFFTCLRFRLYADLAPKKTLMRKVRQWFFSNRQILLLPDNIDADEFRQCRVLLRWT